MSRYNHPRKQTFTDYLMQAVFFIVSIALLSFFFPHETSNIPYYALNEPWDDDALIAKESFDIERNDSSWESEKAKVIDSFEPYYKKDLESGTKNIMRLKHDLDSIISKEGLAAEKCDQLVSILDAEYKIGILPNSNFKELKETQKRTILIYSNNEFSGIDIENLKSEQEVYKEMMAQDDEALHSALQRLNISRYIIPNLSYDSFKSQNALNDRLKTISKFIGKVKEGEKIVDKGQIITVPIKEKLDSYYIHEANREKTSSEKWNQFGGQLLYITLCVLALLMYFYQFRIDYLHSFRRMLLVSILCVTFPLLTYIGIRNEWGTVYVIPYCMLPIFIRVFLDSRTAFISHLVSIMLSAIVVPAPFEFVTIQILAGLTAIYSLKQLQQRSDLFIAVVLVIATSMLAYLCTDLIHMNFVKDKVDISTYIGIAAGGGLLLISYLLLFPIEKIFKFTSTVTLVELSNINHPILRRLSEEAPGTFQHSMQVANLSAEVANKIGANTQLVRTGALYHDIGKLKNSVFFTENQSGNNPHNTLPYEDSAQIIIQHVKYGLELAQKHRLPQSIKNFIASHHGRSKTKFFYISYINENPDKEVNGEIFTYPGPNPASTEEAILMMADAVEAASRSLSEYTEESVSNLVDRIVDTQVQEGYFAHCPITFENIEVAKQTFKNKLKSIYHTRISYPELRK